MGGWPKVVHDKYVFCMVFPEPNDLAKKHNKKRRRNNEKYFYEIVIYLQIKTFQLFASLAIVFVHVFLLHGEISVQ